MLGEGYEICLVVSYRLFEVALKNTEAVPINRNLDFVKIEHIMRILADARASYHGSFFYSGNMLDKIRFRCSTPWQHSAALPDKIAKEV